MRTCYIAIGRGIGQALWWQEYARTKDIQKILREGDRMLAIDWTASERKEEDTERANYLYLIPQIYEEDHENTYVNGTLSGVWKGKRILSRMAYYAEVFSDRYDSLFDTDELQLIFLTSSVGDFLMGEAPEIINFLISKISCLYPQCKLHVRTIVYSNEFFKERKLQPDEILYEKTGWFLERYLAEKGKRKYLCNTDEIYVIDKDCCSFEDLFYSIGFSPKLLKKMDRKEIVCGRRGIKEL